MKARAHVIISGRVQGVFFRSSLRNEARMKKVVGWVKNMPSGQVEAVFEGDKDMVDEVIAWCQHGPSGAGVGDVQADWQEYRGDFTGFEIR